MQENWVTNIKDKIKFQKSSSPVDTYFENELLMPTHIMKEKLKQIVKSHGNSLNHWYSVLMHITVQTLYDLQYLTMHLSGYMNSPTEPSFHVLRHGMEYLIQHSHAPIMYSINIISR